MEFVWANYERWRSWVSACQYEMRHGLHDNCRIRYTLLPSPHQCRLSLGFLAGGAILDGNSVNRISICLLNLSTDKGSTTIVRPCKTVVRRIRLIIKKGFVMNTTNYFLTTSPLQSLSIGIRIGKTVIQNLPKENAAQVHAAWICPVERDIVKWFVLAEEMKEMKLFANFPLELFFPKVRRLEITILSSAALDLVFQGEQSAPLGERQLGRPTIMQDLTTRTTSSETQMSLMWLASKAGAWMIRSR